MTGWKYQLSRFLLVGSLSTTVNYLVFFGSAYLLDIYYILASTIGYLSGLVVGYVLNRNWTFSTSKAISKQHHEIARYLLLNATSLVLSLLCLHLLVDWLSLPAWFSNILAIAVSTTTNFLGLKFVVFKSQSNR